MTFLTQNYSIRTIQNTSNSDLGPNYSITNVKYSILIKTDLVYTLTTSIGILSTAGYNVLFINYLIYLIIFYIRAVKWGD